MKGPSHVLNHNIETRIVAPYLKCNLQPTYKIHATIPIPKGRSFQQTPTKTLWTRFPEFQPPSHGPLATNKFFRCDLKSRHRKSQESSLKGSLHGCLARTHCCFKDMVDSRKHSDVATVNISGQPTVRGSYVRILEAAKM